MAGEQFAVVVPLKPGAREAARTLLAQGSPLDAELEPQQVFLTEEEAIFVFESARGADAAVLRAKLWQEWQEHLAAPPRVAESLYSRERAEQPAELSFLPTPGPGDSEGGDIF